MPVATAQCSGVRPSVGVFSFSSPRSTVPASSAATTPAVYDYHDDDGGHDHNNDHHHDDNH